jgi:predicted membrane protein
MTNCNHHPHSSIFSRFVWGVCFILAGILLLGFNTGFLPLEYKQVVFSWPMLLVVAGVINLVCARHFMIGLILSALGLFLLSPRMGVVCPNIGNLILPAILVLVGGIVLFRRRCCPHPSIRSCKRGCGDSPEVLEANSTMGRFEENNIFGGSKRKFQDVLFHGGEVNCIFGGSELDLSKARLDEGITHLEVNCVFGGIAIIVPSNWTVQIKVSSVFGDFVDRGRVPSEVADPSRILRITGNCVFGGGEIRYS